MNEILNEAEYMDIPGVITKAESKAPINKYGIDRLSLSMEELSNDQIDRVYRCLFVYATGFYEIIKQNIGNQLLMFNGNLNDFRSLKTQV